MLAKVNKKLWLLLVIFVYGFDLTGRVFGNLGTLHSLASILDHHIMWNFASNCVAGNIGLKNEILRRTQHSADGSDDETSSRTSREEGLDHKCSIFGSVLLIRKSANRPLENLTWRNGLFPRDTEIARV